MWCRMEGNVGVRGWWGLLVACPVLSHPRRPREETGRRREEGGILHDRLGKNAEGLLPGETTMCG